MLSTHRMAESASRRSDVRQNLELFSVLWLDPSASKPSTLEQLKSVIDYLVTFGDAPSCLRYIQNQPKDARIFLITSGRHGRVIVPELTDVSQVIAIYIFCMDVKANREWSKEYPKVNVPSPFNRFDIDCLPRSKTFSFDYQTW